MSPRPGPDDDAVRPAGADVARVEMRGPVRQGARRTIQHQPRDLACNLEGIPLADLVGMAIAGEGKLACARTALMNDAAYRPGIQGRFGTVQDDFGHGELALHRLATRFEINGAGQAFPVFVALRLWQAGKEGLVVSDGDRLLLKGRHGRDVGLQRGSGSVRLVDRRLGSCRAGQDRKPRKAGGPKLSQAHWWCAFRIR